jgi:LPS-assembly protein
MEINLKTGLGKISKSYIFYKDHNYHLNAESIIKTGDSTFELENTKLTTCEADPPEWTLESDHATIRQHENLLAKGTSLHIKGTPVIYTPYLWVPLTDKRATGLLLPSMGYSSKNGYYYKQGFFWAMREDQDATFYLDYYTDKGLAEGIDYRYTLTPESTGETWIYHVRDKDPSRDLFEFKSYHNQKLPYDISSYLKVHTVNQFDYYTVMNSTSLDRVGLKSWNKDQFGFSSEERLQKYLESNLQVSKELQSGRTYFLGQYRRSLETTTTFTPQNLPEIGFIVNTISRGPASFNMSAKGINFWRDEGQKGQRFDINPNVNLSFGRLVNLTQKIGMRETAYYLADPSLTKYRTIFDMRTALTTKLFRRYPSYVHIVEPSIEYVYIPPVDNDNIPFFDSIDSIQHTSNINYSLTNRISSLSTRSMETRFRLSQSYSLLDVEKKFSPLLAEANVSSSHLDFKLNASYDVHDENISETIADVTIHGQDSFLSISKNFRRASSLSQITLEAGVNRPLKAFPVDLKTKFWYDLHGNGVQQFNVETTYKRQCWGIIIIYDRRPDEYQVSFAVEFTGLATFSL